jgi:hypothetical protein
MNAITMRAEEKRKKTKKETLKVNRKKRNKEIKPVISSTIGY